MLNTYTFRNCNMALLMWYINLNSALHMDSHSGRCVLRVKTIYVIVKERHETIMGYKPRERVALEWFIPIIVELVTRSVVFEMTNSNKSVFIDRNTSHIKHGWQAKRMIMEYNACVSCALIGYNFPTVLQETICGIFTELAWSWCTHVALCNDDFSQWLLDPCPL